MSYGLAVRLLLALEAQGDIENSGLGGTGTRDGLPWGARYYLRRREQEQAI
ncbi:MAG TPA: hypothetical protein VGS80_11720 [Ktedonobacterales bacterium]|nr:hypothetical protein [Ktedonobacterales bacterium]